MTTQTVFRIFHVLFGICWVGAAVFNALFVMPSLRALGPVAGPVMREIASVRKLPVFFAIVSWVTILSGGALAWRDAGTVGFAWFQHGTGAVFGVGALFAILALIYGIAVTAPTANRLATLGANVAAAKRPPTADEGQQVAALQDKMLTAARWGALLLLIASAAMASARYM